jgi:hypothetical protein
MTVVCSGNRREAVLWREHLNSTAKVVQQSIEYSWKPPFIFRAVKPYNQLLSAWLTHCIFYCQRHGSDKCRPPTWLYGNIHRRFRFVLRRGTQHLKTMISISSVKHPKPIPSPNKRKTPAKVAAFSFIDWKKGKCIKHVGEKMLRKHLDSCNLSSSSRILPRT